jgi:hypothetical protein
MMTGHAFLFFLWGIWNCTYIWPMVICCGLPAVGAVAKVVTFGTPPMKKLP